MALFNFKNFLLLLFLAWPFYSLSQSSFFPEAHAAEIQVAVASNFHNPLKEIIENFEKTTEHKALIISGSTGKLYAQILNGAPFHIFLAADSIRPQLLEKNGGAIYGTRISYALGKISLWSPNSDAISGTVKSTLLRKKFSHIAMANPITAPYGKAALQTLKKLGLWNIIQSNVVQGENINQAFQFVFTNNAQLGFVSLAQILDPKIIHKGKRIDVPDEYYDPIKQDAVILANGKSNDGAISFWNFLQSDISKKIIKNYGYGLP